VTTDDVNDRCHLCSRRSHAGSLESSSVTPSIEERSTPSTSEADKSTRAAGCRHAVPSIRCRASRPRFRPSFLPRPAATVVLATSALSVCLSVHLSQWRARRRASHHRKLAASSWSSRGARDHHRPHNEDVASALSESARMPARSHSLSPAIFVLIFLYPLHHATAVRTSLLLTGGASAAAVVEPRPSPQSVVAPASRCSTLWRGVVACCVAGSHASSSSYPAAAAAASSVGRACVNRVDDEICRSLSHQHHLHDRSQPCLKAATHRRHAHSTGMSALM